MPRAAFFLPALIGWSLLTMGEAGSAAPLPSRERYEARTALLRAEEALERGDGPTATSEAEKAWTLESGRGACEVSGRAALGFGGKEAQRLVAERLETCAVDDGEIALLRARLWISLGEGERATGALRIADYLLPRDPRVPLVQAELAARIERRWPTFEDRLLEVRRRAPDYDLSALLLRPEYASLRDDAEVITALERVLRAPAPSRGRTPLPLPGPHDPER